MHIWKQGNQHFAIFKIFEMLNLYFLVKQKMQTLLKEKLSIGKNSTPPPFIKKKTKA